MHLSLAMAEAVGAIGLVASCLQILQTIEQINKFARQNIHTNASAKQELSPLLGKLAAYEGLIRGIKLQAELDEADRVRLHIDGPLKACETALKTIGEIGDSTRACCLRQNHRQEDSVGSQRPRSIETCPWVIIGRRSKVSSLYVRSSMRSN